MQTVIRYLAVLIAFVALTPHSYSQSTEGTGEPITLFCDLSYGLFRPTQFFIILNPSDDRFQPQIVSAKGSGILVLGKLTVEQQRYTFTFPNTETLWSESQVTVNRYSGAILVEYGNSASSGSCEILERSQLF